MRGWTAVVVFLGAMVACPAVAKQQTLRLDPQATEIGFTLSSTLHDVHGRLYLDHGEIRFDLETGEATGEIVLDARRAETGNAKRDKKMHKKVLESETFPEIRFSASGIEGRLPATGAGTVTLRGTISIHGGDHPAALVAEVSRDGDRLRGTFTLPVPYIEWGMANPSVFFLRVGKVVEVNVKLQGTLE